MRHVPPNCCYHCREWNKEVARAQRNKRDPKLRNAMFRLFAPNVILDGLLVLLFVLVRCLLPLLLGQLLLQFQRTGPVALNATTTVTPFDGTSGNALEMLQAPLNRSTRSIPDYNQLRGNLDGLNEENEKSYHHLKAVSDHVTGE